MAACVLFAAAVLAALFGIASCVLVPKNNQSQFGEINAEANGIQGEHENSIDVVFIGDSLTYSAFAPKQMFAENGFTSYVCASSSQSLPYGNTLLQRALANQSPKAVVFEANSIYAKFSPGNAAVRALSDVIPALEYHTRWKSISAADFLKEPVTTWTDEAKGHYADASVVPADAAAASAHMAATGEREELPLLNRLYLLKMAEDCRRAGAEPIVVSVPSVVCWNMKRHNGMEAFCREVGIRFIDLNMPGAGVEIDWNTETRDKGDHVNSAGAVKISRMVGGLLKTEYDLPNRRGDAAFSAWLL